MVVNAKKEKTPQVRRVNYDISSFLGIDGYTDESVLPQRFCSYGYNISSFGGVIQDGVGVGAPVYNSYSGEKAIPSLIGLEERITRFYQFRCLGHECLIALGGTGAFYTLNLTLGDDVFTRLEGLTGEENSDFTAITYYLNGRDTLLIFYSGGVATYDGVELSVKENTPVLDSAVMLYDRVFGVSGSENKLYFSAPLAPTDFSVENGGGHISFMDEGGKLLRVAVLGGAVYVFREFSIERLSVYGSPEDYVLTKVCSLSSPVKPKTVAFAGEHFVLMIGDYLYEFNGYSLKVIERGLTALIEGGEPCGVHFDGRYYLACRLKTRGEEIGDERTLGCNVNNGLIFFNILTGEVGVSRGFDVLTLCPILTSSVKGIFCTFGNARAHRPGRLNYEGTLFGEYLEKLWCSPKTVLGDPENLKHLRRAYCVVESAVTLTVYQGNTVVSRVLYGSPKSHVIPFQTIGYDFGFSFSTVGPISVSGIKFIFDFVRRYC